MGRIIEIEDQKANQKIKKSQGSIEYKFLINFYIEYIDK